MLPLISIHDSQTDGKKRNAAGIEENHINTIKRAVEQYEQGNPETTMRNAFKLTKHTIAYLGMQENDSNHIAHYLYKATATQTDTLQHMLMAYYFAKQSKPSDIASENIHANEIRLLWMANVAGGRKPAFHNPDAFSLAESLVKQAVALERLHETVNLDDANHAKLFLGFMNIEMKKFNDGAIAFLTNTADSVINLNKPIWFEKYRNLAPNDIRWM